MIARAARVRWSEPGLVASIPDRRPAAIGEGPENPNAPASALADAARASDESRWHVAADAADRAMLAARIASDFVALARAAEIAAAAHAQIRSEATNAANGGALIAGRDADLPDPVPPGCYLLQPPMVGADAARFRAMAREAGVPVMVLAREPLTRAGQWPIVSVGQVILRVRLDPPPGVARVEGRMTGDDYPGPAPLGWFLGAHDRLAAAALERIDADEHPHHRVDDLLELYSALPDHAQIAATLAATAREASNASKPTAPRWRPVIDDPYSF